MVGVLGGRTRAPNVSSPGEKYKYVALRHRFGLDSLCEWSVVRGMRSLAREAVKSHTLDMIAAEIEWISGMPLKRVRVLWRTTFTKEVNKELSRDLLVRMLAWRIQEKAFGGHDAATLRLLGAYCHHDSDKVELFRRLKVGSSVVREYRGVRYIVTIGDDGFIWQGRTYKSLSAIAREVTGSKWNGPRFFGLRSENRVPRTRKIS